MLALGTAAPHFALPDVVTGHTITLDTFADKKAMLVMFICRHCKYVQHVVLSRFDRASERGIYCHKLHLFRTTFIDPAIILKP